APRGAFFPFGEENRSVVDPFCRKSVDGITPLVTVTTWRWGLASTVWSVRSAHCKTSRHGCPATGIPVR
ncbi:uncharacterized protein L969DRAFT_47237, partial [Mixia osmundae IAM 14324]|uniref:uncharacterized protein n=1 Tax=Mixia osmundae (strain CBS 9802 / IAM 14324 / JCM 22182 / KY 12970) TaxID=764103 RepID=UPI0004A55228